MITDINSEDLEKAETQETLPAGRGATQGFEESNERFN
jgi:hypothetical protein